MNYDYNQVIEYIDCTLDENFNNAQKWAIEHGTTFTEDLSKRKLPKRYFVIGDEPQPYTPSEDEKKIAVRTIRNSYLQETDFTQLNDAPISEEEKASYRLYRVYLRDYTETENWWENNPKTYIEWLNDESGLN